MSADLASYAAREEYSRGRHHPEPPPGNRSEYQRDRDRIIHSAAFRRLEYKTQVFINHEGDHFRTRLTHSLEVAQLARTVARNLQLNVDLSEAISLAHDLGHTPFGHAGQEALNTCMKPYGGFEHNVQSLRVVEHLEDKYASFPGLNLSFETREGILKHCSLKNARKLGDVGERFLQRRQPSLEAQLANVADEIAYNNHDIDDGLRAELLSVAQMRAVALFRSHHDQVLTAYGRKLNAKQERHETIRRIINTLVVDLTESSRVRIAGLRHVDEVRAQAKPLMAYSDEIAEQSQELKRFLLENLYRQHRVYRMTVKAQRVVRALFDALFEDIRLLPPDHLEAARKLEAEEGPEGRARAVADYIAGMTDRYALDEYDRLFDPRRLR